MSLVHSPYQVGLALLLVALSVLSVTLVTSIRPVSAAPTGTYFDHIVIIAMENTAYASVFGSGTVSSCPTSSAPFLCSLLCRVYAWLHIRRRRRLFFQFSQRSPTTCNKSSIRWSYLAGLL